MSGRGWCENLKILTFLLCELDARGLLLRLFLLRLGCLLLDEYWSLSFGHDLRLPRSTVERLGLPASKTIRTPFQRHALARAERRLATKLGFEHDFERPGCGALKVR